MMYCAGCVFLKNGSCVLREDENFKIMKDGDVYSCINRIYDVSDLSKEGKIKLEIRRNEI